MSGDHRTPSRCLGQPRPAQQLAGAGIWKRSLAMTSRANRYQQCVHIALRVGARTIESAGGAIK